MFKKTILRFAMLLCVLSLIAVVAPSFINWNSYKAQLLAQINKHDNFSVAIDGNIKLSLLPSPQLSISNVSIKNEAQTKDHKPFVKLKRLSFAVDFLPLLSKKISIRSVELIEPLISINQESKDTEKKNVGSSGVSKIDTLAKNEAQDINHSKISENDSLSLDIAKASIVDGVVTLIDAKTKKRTEIKAINLNGAFSFTNGFDMKASANVDGMQVAGSIKGSSFVGGLPSVIEALCTVKQDKGIEAALTISATHKDGLFAIKAKSDSVQIPIQIQLGDQTIDLAKGIQFSADTTLHENIVTINAFKAKLADINVSGKGIYTAEKNTGSLTLTLTSNVMNATGTVGVDLNHDKPVLHINFSLPKLEDKAWKKTDTANTSSGKEEASFASSERWSKDPIDLSGLQAVDADIMFAIDTLKLSEIGANKVKINVQLNNGVATVKHFSAHVFDGNIALTGALNSKTGQLTTDTKLTQVNVLKLPGVKGSALKSGTLNLSAAITTKATSMHAVINNLNGAANFNVSKGVIEGIDIKQFMIDLKTTKDISGLSKLKASFERKADIAFNHVSGDVKLASGVANTKDFEIDMNEGVIKNAGKVDLPNWVLALNSTLTVRDAKNIPSLSLNISGSLDQPDFALDMNQLQSALVQLATNQLADRAKDTLKKKVVEQLGGSVKGDMADKVGGEAAKAIGKLLPGLFG